MVSLKGKSAIVTGTKRIGSKVVEKLSEEGVSIVILYNRSVKEAEALSASLATKSIAIQCDLNSEVSISGAFKVAQEYLGFINFLVNIASGFKRTPFNTLTSADWDEGMADAKNAFMLSQYAAHAMMNNDGPSRGHIISFGDWAADLNPYKNYLPYLVSKAAVHYSTKALAVELASQGILVNAIAPGPTIRPPSVSEEVWEQEVISQTPLGKESSSEDIAEIVTSLLKMQTITGEIIRVDSGRHLAGPGVEP